MCSTGHRMDHVPEFWRTEGFFAQLQKSVCVACVADMCDRLDLCADPRLQVRDRSKFAIHNTKEVVYCEMALPGVRIRS